MKILAQSLKRLLTLQKNVASRDDTRPYCMGIHLSMIEGAAFPTIQAVATDGYKLAVLEIPVVTDPDNLEPITLTEGIYDLSTIKGLKRSSKSIEIETNTVDGVTRLSVKIEEIETLNERYGIAISGKFPNWKPVVKENKLKGEVVGLNGNYLAKMMEVLSMPWSSSLDSYNFRMRSCGKDNPIVFNSISYDDNNREHKSLGLVMPIRIVG